MIQRTRTEGFSLLEVLVAVTILGIAFVTLFQSFSTGLGLAERARTRTLAIMHARSVIDGVLAEKELEKGRDSGQLEGPYEYRTEIREVETDKEDEEGLVHTFEVTVEVSWGGSGVVTLTARKTIRDKEDEKGG